VPALSEAAGNLLFPGTGEHSGFTRTNELTNSLPQRRYGMSRTEPYLKSVLVSAADHSNFAGILSDPNHLIGIHKDFHAVHIFKHDKFHVASFWSSPVTPRDDDYLCARRSK
jgi:hypothetical protein